MNDQLAHAKVDQAQKWRQAIWKHLSISNNDLNILRRNFRKRAKFYVDESVSQNVVTLLRQLNLNVKTFKEEKLGGHPDENHFGVARKLGRILVSQDNDFWDKKKFPISNHPGVIILKNDETTDNLVSVVRTFLDVVAPFGEIWSETKILIDGNQIKVYSYEADNSKWVTSRYKLDKNGIPYLWANE